jgi:glycosyltransferase involved in cell wall biosynthesis
VGAGADAGIVTRLADGHGRSDAMNVLFIHQNFPGQFIHLAAELAKSKHNRVVALSICKMPVPHGVELRCYTMLRQAAADTHPLLKDQDAKVMRAEACAAAALQLKREGFVPDVVVAHPGWGESLFVKDVFPQAKLLVYCEFYYAAEGRDVGFDPEQPAINFQQRCQLRMRNAHSLLSLEAADAAISPTHWQKSLFPSAFQDKIHVIHDGIDFSGLKPNPKAQLRLAQNAHRPELLLRPGMEVLSYVARNLEAVRGFHVMMRLLPTLLKARPEAHVVIVGGNGLSYGAPAPGGGNWQDYMMAEVGAGLDLRRVHFVGKIPYSAYLDLLNVSKVHSYWTTPFVLSWSLLEAAVHGVPVVASNTPPVQEFAARLGIRLVDFFDQAGFVEALAEQLARAPEARQNRPVPDEIKLSTCLRQQIRLIQEL